MLNGKPDMLRSLIYVDCAKEQYRVKLQHWLYYHHIPESISQFGPYVTKYAFYDALPTPPEGDRFGTNRMQLTEHYWLLNCHNPGMTKTFMEFFDPNVLKWQGIIPDDVEGTEMDGDSVRSAGRGAGNRPFIFAFVPVCWDEDIKGSKRTWLDGPNYRWQFIVKYPESITREEGDKWLKEEVIPFFNEQPEVTRILTSKVVNEANGCPFHRVVEMWFEGPDEWFEVAVKRASSGLKRPEWAQQDRFPFMSPFHNFNSLFLSDKVTSDNYSYRGYQTLR